MLLPNIKESDTNTATIRYIMLPGSTAFTATYGEDIVRQMPKRSQNQY
jgi:hypothetical protein